LVWQPGLQVLRLPGRMGVEAQDSSHPDDLSKPGRAGWAISLTRPTLHQVERCESPHAVNVEGFEMPAIRKDTLFRYRRREFFCWSEPWHRADYRRRRRV